MLRSMLEIDKDSLRENVRRICRFSANKIIAVVKANAYGMGAKGVSRAIEPLEELYGYAVACVEEGLELRNGGIKKDILILGGILPEDVDFIEQFKLTPVVSDVVHLRALDGKNIKFHVKYDTGMGRLGFLDSLIDDSRMIGIMSHLSSSSIDESYSNIQIEKFGKIARMHKNVRFIHLQNSAGITYKIHYTNLVRIGLALYGEQPCVAYPINLIPSIALKAKIISIKSLPKDHSVSYNKTFTTKQKTTIGIVSFGYADGLIKSLSNKGFMIVNGIKVPIIGDITMDMTIVDITHVRASVGDWAYIVGQGQTFTQLASLAGTIPYEIMCNISDRVKRVYT